MNQKSPQNQPNKDDDNDKVKFKDYFRVNAAVATGIAISALALIGAGGVTYYNQVMPASTIINQVDVSLKGIENAADTLLDKYDTKNLKLSLTSNVGGDVSCTADDLGFTVDRDALKEQLHSIYQDPNDRYNFATKEKNVDLTFHLDENKFSQFFQEHISAFNAPVGEETAPVNSYVTFDEASGKFVAAPEICGNTRAENGEKNLMAHIATALTGNTEDLYQDIPLTIDTALGGYYLRPEITTDSPLMLANLEVYNEFFGRTITLDLSAGATEDIILTDHQDWFSPQYMADNPNQINAEQPFVIDEEKIVEQYIRGYLSPKVDTFANDSFSRPFHTSGGQDIVMNHGYYGWWIDKQKTKDAMLPALKNYKSGNATVPVVYILTAKQHSADGHDYGNTYAEVSIAGQHMWFYKDGVCVMDSPVVTGKPYGNATPTGINGLTYKQHGAVLRGADYETPVTYWMPFDRDVGFHDAVWQAAFGGQRYLTYGSHGCVNMPYDKAAQLFDLIYDMCPVIVY